MQMPTLTTQPWITFGLRLAFVAIVISSSTVWAQDSESADADEAAATEVEVAEVEVAVAEPSPLPPIGYLDAPMIPGTPWRVHDMNRPRPRVVSLDPGTGAPADAIVLFDGSDLSHWRKSGKQPGELLPAGWKVENGYMEVVPGSGGIQSVDTFGDCQLHIEWSAPNPPESSSQGRGNSGVIIMGRYEIQVLDSYNNLTYADGQAASIYGQYPPMVNVTRPPGEWNVYDIVFKTPVFDGKKLVKPGYVTVFHNGTLVHYHRRIIGQVAHKDLAKYNPHPPAGSLHLQDHGNPTRFRNIWVRPLELD